MTNNILKIFLVAAIFLIPQLSFSEGVVELKGVQTSTGDCSWGRTDGKYCMLAPIPYLGGETVDVYGGGLSSYLKAIYRMGIIAAIALSIIMITMGGLKYASTDAINGKEEGKQMIQQALLGLVLALMSYLLLQQINPALLRSDIGNLQDVQGVNKKIGEQENILKSESTNQQQGPTTSNDGGLQVVPDLPLPTNNTPTNPGPNPLLPPIEYDPIT